MPNYNDPSNLYNYVYSRLEPNNRNDFKRRFDWNISNNTKAYVRIAQEGETVESPRGVWWGPADVALPSPNIGTNRGRSYAGNVVSVLSPTMTNEIAGQLQPPDARQSVRGPGAPQPGSRRHDVQRHLPRRLDEPVPPDRHPPRMGRQRAGRQPVGGGERRLRAQRRAAVQRQADEARRRARPEVRHRGRARAEAAELPEHRGRSALVRHRQRHRAPATRSPTC